MSNVDYLSAAVEIAREAGKVLEHHHEKGVAVEYKGEYDVVTAADRASEKLIVEQLRQRFPAHSIVAEEGGGISNGSEFVWHVDPLDGTTNFAHGFPAFAVSMGLARKGEPIAGVVYDPIRKELFSAEKGSGAYLNNRRIRVSKTAALAESLFGTGFPSPRRHVDVNIHFFHQVSMLSHGIRRAGSAALDLCSVAAGRLDGFWEFGLKTWDVAAGLLIVTEAGGRYGDMKGGHYELGSGHLAATNGAVHEELLRLFDEVFQGRYRVPIPPIVPRTA
jgi:myo-inositol-1(or 4)-monophosphatase